VVSRIGSQRLFDMELGFFLYQARFTTLNGVICNHSEAWRCFKHRTLVCCVNTQSHGAVIFEKNTNSYYYFRLNLSAFRKELGPLKSPDLNQYYYLWGRLNGKSFCKDSTLFTVIIKLLLPFGTQVRGFKPCRNRRIFRAKKSSARLPSEGK
jgi:hypothetical protein